MSKLLIWFSKIWKDPVWSKVIATIICAIGLFFWNLIDKASFYKALSLLNNALTFKVTLSIWMILLVILVLIFLIQVVRYINIKRAIPKRNPILDYKVGNYSFEELYEILRSKRLRDRTEKMTIMGIPAPEETLLEQFLQNYDEFREGISFGSIQRLRQLGVANRNDGGYLTEILAPKLMEYGLIQKIDSKMEGPQGSIHTVTNYVVSDIGYYFYDCLKSFITTQPQLIYRS